jgi:hypothetical protein
LTDCTSSSSASLLDDSLKWVALFSFGFAAAAVDATDYMAEERATADLDDADVDGEGMAGGIILCS